MRKLCESRVGGDPMPLLLLADSPGGHGILRALGPSGRDRPIRLVAAAELLRVLEELPRLEHDVDFVVIGGLAVAAHGYPRATRDGDVVAAPDADNRRRLFTALRSLDAEPIELGDFHPGELRT